MCFLCGALHIDWSYVAVKDALKGTRFDLIDEMLLRLYNLYEKSTKTCRELEEIFDLKEYLCFADAGVKPVCSCGSRWVASLFMWV